MPGYHRPKFWKLLLDTLPGLPSDIFFMLKHRGRNYPRPPLYPHAQSLQKYTHPDHNQVRVYSFETVDSPYAVSAFYKKRLKREGWHFYEEDRTRGIFTFLYLHPRLNLSIHPDYLPRPLNFHSEVRPWYRLEFRTLPKGDLFQVEIYHSVGSPFGWRDSDF